MSTTLPRAGRRTAVWGEIIRTCSCSSDRPLDGVAKWLLITRACVQPMTLTSVAIAGLLAARSGNFNGLFFALAAIGSVLAHAANNMINDLFDLREGLDTATYPRSMYAPHPVLAGLITKDGLTRATLVANAADAAIMLYLFTQRGWPIIGFALAGLFISVFYVAPPLRLKGRGLGEPSVALIWGPVMVGGTYYAAVGSIPAIVYWASLPYALLVTTVLMGKHIDKLEWDAPKGIKTLPVVLGDERARRVTVALMAAFYVSVIALVLAGVLPVWTVVSLIALPLLRKARRTFARPKPAAPPASYPESIWPLWFGPWAFVHATRAGALFVAGLALGAVFPWKLGF